MDEVAGALLRSDLLREAGRAAQALVMRGLLTAAHPGHPGLWLGMARAALEAGAPTECLTTPGEHWP